MLNGISLGQWLKLLSRNRWQVGLPYLGRVAVVTFAATGNSIVRRVEQIRFGRTIDRAVVHPPLFVLGVWRSGTTYLQNLLCRDDRFAFPNCFQGMNPHIFLSTEGWFSPIQQRFLPDRRPFDNVRMGVREPYEDEFATTVMSGLSPLYSWAFPNNHREYEKYIDFSEASEHEVDRWKQAFLRFVKKLSLKYDKPLVLKSPNHTARVRLLLDLFPQARFVCVHRHPYEVYVSNLNLIRRVVPMLTLQRFDVERLFNRTIPWFRTLTEAYFDQKALIPDGHLVEIAFKELEQSPISTLRNIYERLDLPAFDAAEPAVRDYLTSLSGYRKNVHAEIDADTISILDREWRRSFEEWGYAPR